MKKQIMLFLAIVAMALLPISIKAQDAECSAGMVQDLKVLSKSDLETKWKAMGMDAGFRNLLAEVVRKGFVRMKERQGEPTSYGFTCKAQQGSEVVNAEFYAYDFVSKDGKQACSMIWRKKGKDVYKAYILPAKGQKDFFASFEAADEWYADEKNDIQLAHSFKKCFKNCVFKHCPGWCVGAVAGCSIAAAALLETGPGAAVFFAVCAGGFCATCLAVCAIGC